ncbi:sodium:proton antiporter NhaD [Magnetospirillum molischianum]|uniref:Citrate transporter n=1 Tax=Magnetospirillum molischianum DSM 120 TaxID=1150626 RepID=H8FPH3_MAGML|nr:sodium:proton antiporter NhaD [Magnetospirillum molischianum]CCG40261.1 Citrate transporter [Magnetospirillum molischianum DSM 120]
MKTGMRFVVAVLALALVGLPGVALAAEAAGLPDLTGHWVGLTGLALFCLAYALVIAEESTHLRKSKPVVVAAGLMWTLLAVEMARRGQSEAVTEAVRHVFLEYAELLLFLLVAMTYVNALEERKVFDALRSKLVRSGFGYRALFWLTGILAFFISPVADNMTTALVMCAVVLSVGRDQPRFTSLSCINIVVAANAGGAFSPFGDITTLMVWQKGVVPFGDFFLLFLPAVVTFLIPALLMHFALPSGAPSSRGAAVVMLPGARRIAALFGLTIAITVTFHSALHLPPVIGMMSGLGLLQLFSYALRSRYRRDPTRTDWNFDVFERISRLEWDTLLFFYGVMMCVGALGLLGYLSLTSHLLYDQLGPTSANIAIGVLSAIFDNIPLMFAVLTMNPDMGLGQWLLITLTAGVGGSLLSIGSAAGVALMGQARGIYTFSSHLRWSWAVGAGFVGGIMVHRLLNADLF